MKCILFSIGLMLSYSSIASTKFIEVKLPLVQALTYQGRITAGDGTENYSAYVTNYENVITVIMKLRQGHVENLKERDEFAGKILKDIARMKKNDKTITVRMRISE